MPGAEDFINKKILDITGEENFFDTEKSLRNLSREKALIDSESGASLDVSPDFNSLEIFNSLQKASGNLKKAEMISQGKSEEEADASISILFPEKEISKTVELGLNIEKVKDDYLSFLANNKPEKLKDINSAKFVGNFEGENSLRFMQEALEHQSQIIDSKTSNIMNKGEENLTDQDIAQIERFEDQQERLGERYRNLINEYPEIRDKVFKEKASQQRVDDSYKQAKANVLLPGFDGTKAQAEVLYHQVISPIGASAVGMVENIVKLGTNQLQGLSDEEAIKGTAGIVSDWATGFFDTEKSSSVFKKPSELKGELFKNGDIQAEKIVPKVSETLFQMYALLAGGTSTGSAIEKLGFASKASQNAGLITSSYVLSQNDYFEEAKSLGLSDSEANNFANASALLTSTLELVNPQKHVFGKESKRAFTKSVVNMINKGVDMKEAIKQNSKFVGKELIGENAQETLQLLGDMGSKYVFNKQAEDDVFDVNVTQDEIKEMLLLTSIVSGAGAAPGVKGKSSLETESLFRATDDIGKFKEFLSKPETQERFTEEEIKQADEKVTEYKKIVDGLPKELNTNKKIELANLVYNKKKLNESKSEVFTDDVVAGKAGDNIQTQVNEINGQIELLFDENPKTNIDKPLDNLTLKTNGDVEYKVGDQFFSQKEMIENLNNEEFVKSVTDGSTNLTISNPSPEVAAALKMSGVLTNSQLETIKPLTDEIIQQPEGEAETKVETETKTEAKDKAVLDSAPDSKPKTEVLESIDIPQEKMDKLTELKFTEESINELSEEQIDTIIEDKVEFTEDTDLKTVGKPVAGKVKIDEGFSELEASIPEGGAPANVFNPPAAFTALKKIVEGVVEETGLKGAKLISELKSRVSEKLGEDYSESDIDDVSKEIIEFSKSIEKIEEVPEKDQKQTESKPEKEEPKPSEKPKSEPSKKKESSEKGPEKKQSGFQKRTLETAEGSPAKEQVKTVVEENKQFYTVMNVQGTVDQAAKEIADEGGFDAAFEGMIVLNPTISELPLLQAKRQLTLDFYGKELDSAVKDGRKKDVDKAYRRTKALQDAISRDATIGGQATSMLQIWKSLRPDGTVEFMDRRINDYNDKIKKDKVKGIDKTVSETIESFRVAFENLTTEQIDEILNSEQGQAAIDKAVAKNISGLKNDLKERSRKRKAKVDSVVNRLDSLKISQDKLFALPPGVNLVPAVWNGSIEVIKKSLQAGETMASAIDKAVEYIKSNVGEDDFGEDAYRNEFAEEKKSLDTDQEISKEIDDSLKELGVNIKDVIKKHYSEKDALSRTLAEKLVEESGMTNEEAANITSVIEKEFNAKIKDRAEKELSKALGVTRLPVTKEVKKLAEDLIEKVNLGALDSDFYNSLFAEKFGLAQPLTPEQRTELKRLASIAQKQRPDSYLHDQATMDMLRYMDNIYPKKNRFNVFMSLFYGSMLSGMSTSVLNIVSGGSNIGMKPIQDFVNLSKWLNAARKGLENKSFKDFLAYAPFNDVFYTPAAITHAVSLGSKEFADVWKNGDVDSKFIEQVANKEFSKLNPLERERYGKNAFKPINVTVAGRKISINPFNYYKYSGRNLAAQDKLMFRTSYEMELMSIIREKELDKGLRGAELRKAVIDEFTQRNVDTEAVWESVNKEVAEYEKDTGKKIDKRQKEIIVREILEKNMDPEVVGSAQSVGRSRIFTDQRGGTIANAASAIGKLANSSQTAAIALKPWVPFTRVVGNVAEYMMDTIPLIGHARANGISVTSTINRSKNLDVKTSQMGLPGTREYQEQMGRAWMGTAAFLAAASLLVGTDEDDETYITGGYAPDKFKRGRENVTPKYTLVIKGVEIPYLNIPGLAIPLAAIGNYNDRINMGDSEESLEGRAFYTTMNTLFLVKDMSFLKGVQDLLNMVTDLSSGEAGKFSRASKELYKKYFLTATKPLPQNFNLIDQIEKIYDPTSFQQKDIEDITMYGLGIQKYTNNASLDLFGDEIKTLPGSTLLPYEHWLGIKGNDERWKFLAKYNSMPNTISGYDKIDFFDSETEEIERRAPEKEELFKYIKEAGKNFDEELREYMSYGGFEEREEQLFKRGDKQITGIQKDIAAMWSRSKKTARLDLFSN